MTHTLDCGCKAEEIFHEKDSWGREGAIRIDIVYCPMHKAAPEMLEALKDIANTELISDELITIAKQAIANTEGKT